MHGDANDRARAAACGADHTDTDHASRAHCQASLPDVTPGVIRHVGAVLPAQLRRRTAAVICTGGVIGDRAAANGRDSARTVARRPARHTAGCSGAEVGGWLPVAVRTAGGPGDWDEPPTTHSRPHPGGVTDRTVTVRP